MFITTSKQCSRIAKTKARELANELLCEYIERGKYTLSQLMGKIDDKELLLVEDNNVRFLKRDKNDLFFHPNLAKIRITSMLKGSHDRLIEIAQVQKGDAVLDCTMGLATDAIVFSFAVGEKGNVVTVESESILALLAREGLQSYKSGIDELDGAMERVIVVHADHFEYMKRQPDKSFDVVYFDPMFRQPVNTIALTPLREIANNSAVRIDAIKEAKRIARKKIILKERPNSREFERLGFEEIFRNKSSDVIYGTINCFA